MLPNESNPPWLGFLGFSGRAAFDTLFGFPEAVAFPIGLQDVHPMGEPVQQGSGQAFGAEDFGPLFKGQVCGDHHNDVD